MHDWSKHLTEADDTQLREALFDAHLPALMATLLHLNGNLDHCAQVQPQFDLFAEDDDGLSDAERQRAHELAFAALVRYRDAGAPELARPDPAQVISTMHYITGTDFPEEYLPFLQEELNLFEEDTRKLEVDTSNMGEDFKVLIIGAGMSGILAAIRLKQLGVPFLIVEKNPEIGGTWYENTYPGCQVDSANHLYNYIFEPNHQWPNYFSGQSELNAYFNRVVDKYELRPHIRLNTPVISAQYRDSDKSWEVIVEHQGQPETLLASTVISAVGQLNSPKYPDIKGQDTFNGIAFHSARWEHQHDLSDKRVIVIGTGCSAVQFVPEIAPRCDQLTVFQRTPPWLLPSPDYHQKMPPAALWLMREVPFYARWYRFFLFRARGVDGHLPLLYTEPGWDGPAGTISEANEMLRAAFIAALAEQTGDDTELLAKLIPDYPPGGKRPVLDDGAWIETLQSDNVQLVTEPISEIVPQGVITADGKLHHADVLIYGTGFKADHFLVPMQITGKDGTELVSYWGDDARAYKGVMVSNFPNFYCLYGPNTNIVVGSSIIFFVECQMRYITGCLKLQLENKLQSVECRQSVQDAYNLRIDELNQQRAWGSPSVSSWYKNEGGRVTQNWPGTHWEFWQQMQHPDPADFILE